MIYSVKIIFAIFLLLTPIVTAQPGVDPVKRQATALMREGRYKEAIDQLNKFISSNPREADGYHIRGLCYEKTTEYQYSVLDLRRARRLDPNNPEIKKDLDRVIAVWHELLYKKIAGHKRDIAVDPNNPYSYLEIGKSYRWLEEWNNAEIWYDQYLLKDDTASPDEIIRYTEILAKTGSIVKGEKILKKYVERYPEDWRLWSRFGYFSMWLSKIKVAEDAFLKALGFKPFFKEAQDGLDLTRNQAYLSTYQPRSYERTYPIDRFYGILEKSPNNDDIRFNLIDELINANRYDEAYQQLQILQNKYSEDDRFKTLYKTVSDFRDSTLNNLVAVYTDSLKSNPSNKEYVMKLATTYSNLYYYDSAIEILEEYLSTVPEDQDLDARFKLAQYSAWNYEWEKAIAILKKLLIIDPNNVDYQLLRGQIGVWTVLDFDIAEKYLLNVVAAKPNSIDAYISLASMYSWKKNFPEARKYLDIAKNIAPHSQEIEGAENNYALHLSAYEEQKVFEIRLAAGVLVEQGDCEGAVVKYEEYKSKRTALSLDELKEYANFASCAKDYPKAIAIYDEILNQQFDYESALQRARDYYENGDTTLALSELEKLSKIKPGDQQTRIYYADALTGTNQLQKAEMIYRGIRFKAADADEKEVLEDMDFYSSNEFKNYLESNPDSTIQDAYISEEIKNQIETRMMYLGDSYVKNKNPEKAEEIYDELLNTSKDENVKSELPKHKIFLADAYSLKQDYGKAEDIYEELLDEAKDTSEINLLNQRIKWLPKYGFSKSFYSMGNFFLYFLPTNIGLSPFSNLYRDNQNFSLFNYGLRLDAGFIGILGLGGYWGRYHVNILNNSSRLTTIKGTASIYFSQKIILTGSYGILNIPGEANKNIGDLTVRYENPDVFSLVGYYENNDARLLLYSPTLIFTRYKSELFRISSFYLHRNVLKLSGFYSYYKISDENFGNDFQFRIGRKFIENFFIGYEYYFADYAFVSTFYYSPQEFSSHSIWGEYNFVVEKELKIKLGCKIGYVPKVDFVINELYAEANYSPLPTLNLVGRIGYSNSFRYDTNYQSFSSMFSVYWNIY